MAQRSSIFRSPAYGWVIVVLAALAMVATFPGRTFGLGMITERLLKDEALGLTRLDYGDINLYATLLGAVFCIPVGWMLDRCGVRVTSTLILAALGTVVMMMTNATSALSFAFLVTLTRGFGQSALSVVSISMTGKWFREKLPLATGVYSVLVSIGFACVIELSKRQHELEWRTQWWWLGAILLFGFAPVFALFVRSSPDVVPEDTSAHAMDSEDDFTLTEALSTPAFWMFGIATSFYGLVSSGTSLFSESLLTERGFESTAFYDLQKMTITIGMVSNFLTGWVATRVRLTVVTSVAMSLLAASLLGLPFVSTYPGLIAYAVAMGCAGGMVTVLFFTIWARLFGRAELGRIQGVAQMLTVFASALGPKILAEVKDRCGSYLPAIVVLGAMAALLAVAIAIVPIPNRKPQIATNPNLAPVPNS